MYVGNLSVSFSIHIGYQLVHSLDIIGNYRNPSITDMVNGDNRDI